MNQDSAGKIYPRSPRYVLQMKDKKILRYAPHPRGNRAFFTEIINLSETGMAFTVPFLDSPHKNEIIMVEFTPPGASSIACYAQVKRIQKFSIIESDFFQKNCKLVAVEFTNLPDVQREMIRNSLETQFKKIQRNFRLQQWKLKLLWNLKFNRKKIVYIFAAGLGIFLSAYGAYSLLY
ncbi:MAG: PilZ domain-containing protein [Bdellovibrionaceae bacterium]|nr:PilZ domain-containing protein [Pseudobdellovibrionaceae bacterium]